MSDIHAQTKELLQQLQDIGSRVSKLREKPSTGRTLPPYHSYAMTLQENPPKPPTPAFEPSPTDELPKEAETLADTLPSASPSSSIGFELWEALAYDIALDSADMSTIASGYGLTLAQLSDLQNNPYFVKMLAAKREEVKSLGSEAAFAIKMRMVANKATPQFLQRLTSPETPTRDFHALFKTAVELAQLMPQPSEDAPPPAVIGASVTFNIQGVPGLEHLSASATQETPNTDVTDAEWQEVIDHQATKLNKNDELAEL